MDPHRWRLDGQLALVTGGSAGIGLAIARELLGFGARVLITARNGDSLERARDELAEEFPDGDIGALIADVADDEQRRELLDWVEDQDEGLNNLVNNAGGNLRPDKRRVGNEGVSTSRHGGRPNQEKDKG